MKFLIFLFTLYISLHVILAAMEASLNGVDVLMKGTTEGVNFDKLKVKRLNKTHYAFLGELEVFEDFGNQFTITGLIYQMQGYEYRLTPFKLGPEGWCDFIEKNEFLYKEFLPPVSDFPEIKDCPWKKGVYHIIAFVVDSNNLPPFLRSGDYKMQMIVKKGEKVINGFDLLVRITAFF